MENTKLTQAEIDAFAKVTEIIGQMALGRGLPSPFTLIFPKNPLQLNPNYQGENQNTEIEIEKRAIQPVNMEPIFDAIFSELQKQAEWQPYVQAVMKIERQQVELAKTKQQLEKVLKVLDDVKRILTS